jgi:hypothetical protein
MMDFIGIASGIILGVMIYDVSLPLHNDEIIASRAAIEQCELNLPRNQRCQIIAIVKDSEQL